MFSDHFCFKRYRHHHDLHALTHSFPTLRSSDLVDLLHVVQRKEAVAARGDLSGAIGLGVKTSLMEELVELEAADAKLQVERGRMLLAAGEKRLRDAGAFDVRQLHRHGASVETITQRTEDAGACVSGQHCAAQRVARRHNRANTEPYV